MAFLAAAGAGLSAAVASGGSPAESRWVDDPVVAGDAIKRDLAHGHPSIIAAWLGPTKLATANEPGNVTSSSKAIMALLREWARPMPI